MLTHFPDTALLERGQEFRLLDPSASLLLVVELFGQLLGQSQVSCKQNISYIKKTAKRWQELLEPSPIDGAEAENHREAGTAARKAGWEVSRGT